MSIAGEPRLPRAMGRQLLILAAAFLGVVGLALALGAVNLGTALGVGQLTFAATLVWLLMTGSPLSARAAPGDGSSSSATEIDRRRHLEVRRLAGVDEDGPPAASISIASSVAFSARLPPAASASRSASVRNT